MAKPRYTNLVDLSPNDIMRHVGMYGCDTDFEFFDKDFNTICILDFKHHNGDVDLNQFSLQYRKNKAGKLGCPFYLLITWTKPGEQSHDMFYVISMNAQAYCKLTLREGTEADGRCWMTPRKWAQFVCYLSGQEITEKILNMHEKLADNFETYRLPEIRQ